MTNSTISPMFESPDHSAAGFQMFGTQYSNAGGLDDSVSTIGQLVHPRISQPLRGRSQRPPQFKALPFSPLPESLPEPPAPKSLPPPSPAKHPLPTDRPHRTPKHNPAPKSPAE